MKAFLEDIPSKQGGASFYKARLEVASFEFKWHYHPEYELTYIVKGNGYRIVGNSHEPFAAGDLVLLGSNLPHTWHSKAEDSTPSEAIVIQFSKAFIAPFLTLNEAKPLDALLVAAKKGLHFEVDPALVFALRKMVESQALESVLDLLRILNSLTSKKYKTLTSTEFHNVSSKTFELRINKVCTHLQKHFAAPITLTKIAELVHMSESNFCKFFKKATSTTFSDYLNELRINEACHLLIYSEDNISKIAQDCGFESLSYFNRVFLKKKHVSPSLFRKNANALL
jgi:AraC-like DNA-binding protein